MSPVFWGKKLNSQKLPIIEYSVLISSESTIHGILHYSPPFLSLGRLIPISEYLFAQPGLSSIRAFLVIAAANATSLVLFVDTADTMTNRKGTEFAGCESSVGNGKDAGNNGREPILLVFERLVCKGPV